MEHEYKPYEAAVIASNIFNHLQGKFEGKAQYGSLGVAGNKSARVFAENLTQIMILLQARHLGDKGNAFFKEPISYEKNGEFKIHSEQYQEKYGDGYKKDFMKVSEASPEIMRPEDRKWLEGQVNHIVKHGEHLMYDMSHHLREALVFKYPAPLRGPVRLSDLKKIGILEKEKTRKPGLHRKPSQHTHER